MSSQISVRESEERERRIRKIRDRINELRQKYGMDFNEFFDSTEDMRKYEELIKKGFDPGEILRDVTEWEELEEELEELEEE